MQNYINKQFDELSEAVQGLKKYTPQIAQIADVCTTAVKNGHKVIFCGKEMLPFKNT